MVRTDTSPEHTVAIAHSGSTNRPKCNVQALSAGASMAGQPLHQVRAEKTMFYNVPVIISSSQAGEVVPEKGMMNEQGNVENIFAGWHAGLHLAAGSLPPPPPPPPHPHQLKE